MAISPSNIIAGFKVSGIYPFNKDIFPEQEFLPSYSTDRPENVSNESSKVRIVDNNEKEPVAGPSRVNNLQESSLNRPSENEIPTLNSETIETTSPITPLKLKPLPKAQQSKTTRSSRNRRSTTILTDSPVRKALREEQANYLKNAKTKKVYQK